VLGDRLFVVGKPGKYKWGNTLLSLWLRRANRCKSHAISKTEVGTDVTERSGVFVHFDLGTT
jgi:hypothetical protein